MTEKWKPKQTKNKILCSVRVMMESPLNNAHFCARQAENLMRKQGSELECLEYIDKCITVKWRDLNLENSSLKIFSLKNLDLSLKSSTSPKAIESIKLQKDHHIRQRELLQYLVDKHRNNETKQKTEVVSEKIVHAFKAHNDLFENMRSTDTTLEELQKMSSDQTLSIGRLSELNLQLHGIISQLVNQVDETVIENDTLRRKLKDFECRINSSDAKQQNDYENSEQAETREEFAPLDLPKFDVP